MKCDLCRDQRVTGSRLCISCGEMIRRLVNIEIRLHNAEVCEAQRLECQTRELEMAASNEA